MATKDQIQEFARKQADGLLLTYLLAEHYKQQPDPKAFSREHLRFLELLSDNFEVVAAVPPAERDLAAQEIRDMLIRTALRARSQATDEPFDPEAFRLSWR